MFRVRIKTKEGYKEYVVEELKELQDEFNKPNEGVYVDNISHYEVNDYTDKERERILTLKR